MSGRILTPNQFDLTFLVPDYGAKFHQNRARIATVGGWTDKHPSAEVINVVPRMAVDAGNRT